MIEFLLGVGFELGGDIHVYSAPLSTCIKLRNAMIA